MTYFMNGEVLGTVSNTKLSDNIKIRHIFIHYCLRIEHGMYIQ